MHRGLYRASTESLQNVITNQAELTRLTEELEQAEAIALDTEFLREKTYRAQLCLLQLATTDRALCVDPLAVADLRPLAAPLGAARPVKVMHAARQDVEVLAPAIGVVGPIFDTQIAAALAGLPTQVGLAEAVRRLLGRELSKAHTRTDWSRRPLSPEQIDYALDDVRYLLPLKSALEETLERLGRLDWLQEELASLVEDEWIAIDPSRAWLRIRGLKGLDEGRTRLARALAAWRERRAIERDRPRGWILEDATLREIVLRVPRTEAQLAAVPELPPAVAKHCAKEILALVEEADIPDPPPPLTARRRPDPTVAALVRKLGAIAQARAAELGVSPELLATRRDLEQLAEGRRDVSVLSGWRRRVLGEQLLAAL
jgi:ribonuclease D|nr:MAG: ribonuclease D [Pseudomonadota bacterium]